MPRPLYALLLACLMLMPTWPAAAQTLRIDSALAADGAGSSFPVDTPVRRVALPDAWADTRAADAPPTRWYRVGFPGSAAPASGELLALYIERACTNLEVRLNGQLVHSGGRMDEPLTNNCNHPQLVALPAALLLPALNTLDIQLAGHPLAEVGARARSGGLSALHIGPQSQLATTQARQLALNVTLPQAFGAALLLLGGFMFVLGFVHRSESHLAYFGALSVGWAIADARLWLRTLPLGNAVTEFLLCALLAFMTLAGVQFLLRHAKLRLQLADRGLPLQCALMPLSLVLAGPGHLHGTALVWQCIFALELAAAAVACLLALRRSASRSFWPTAALLAALALAGAVGFAGQWWDMPVPVPQLAQLAGPLLLVVVGLRLVQQHGRVLQEATFGKAQLEQRVREVTAEMERNFRQLSELRIEQVTERERKRIAADLHDDLGAKLLTIVHTSDSERISTLAREALEEMRLSVRGLTGKPVKLADALGDWRAEVVNRLLQAGIEAEWSAPEDLPQTLSARGYVQTTRILREATSNIIKHSRASNCSIQCRVAEGDFQLVVQDNGDGIPLELDGRLDRGHGMASMKHRAKQLQGQCLVESGPGYGTVIRLTVPLDRALEGAPHEAVRG